MSYNYVLECTNTSTGSSFDLTQLAGNMQHSTTLLGNPGKLTFTLQKDPNGIMELAEGSIITFMADTTGIFKGYIFRMDTDKHGIWNVTAYDQMRYLQNHDTIYTTKQTADGIFTRLCGLTGLSSRVDTPSAFIVPDYLHVNKTYYAMMEHSISLADIAETKRYFIRDDFGTLTFTEIHQTQTNLIIGDNFSMSDYKYETSIDNDTYNAIKITRDNEETGLRDVWIEYDSSNQARWGKLQLLTEADKDMNEAQIREKAANLLKWKNRPTRTMKVSIVGTQVVTPITPNFVDTKQLIAGNRFYLLINELGIASDMSIMSATHNYNKDTHLIQLDVFI